MFVHEVPFFCRCLIDLFRLPAAVASQSAFTCFFGIAPQGLQRVERLFEVFFEMERARGGSQWIMRPSHESNPRAKPQTLTQVRARLEMALRALLDSWLARPQTSLVLSASSAEGRMSYRLPPRGTLSQEMRNASTRSPAVR
ncbi:MAG: hypothetical protein ABIZ56_08165 [Chthoniobacteraceae bacterium]